MSAQPTRWVAVDDTDAGIQYVGLSWRLDTGSYDKAGNFGPPYQRTLHGTSVDASFSYLFNGTAVNVNGFNNIRNDSGVLDPTWECLVDDISIQLGVRFQYPEHNWLFCSSSQLPDGLHNLTVKASVKTGQTFWFDDIMYAPSPSASLDEKNIMINNGDPIFQFGDGWQSFSSISNMTQTPNSTITFNFVGSSLTWYGFIPGDYPTAATTGTYSIDDQTPVIFILNGLPPGSTTATYNQKFFETPNYPIGNHKVVVTYLGGPNVTPLVLDYLIINNHTSTSPAMPTRSLTPGPDFNTISPPSNTNTPNPDSHLHNRSSDKMGPVVGGTLGGMALILIAIFAAFYFRRWDKRHSRPNGKETTIQELPKEFIVSPFHYNPEAATTIAPPRRPPPPPVERTRNKLREFLTPDEDLFAHALHNSTQEEGASSRPRPHDAALQSAIDRKRRLAREAEARAVTAAAPSPSASSSRNSNEALLPSTIERKRRRMREVEARASVARESSSSARNPASQTVSVSVPFIIHEDSGIRLSRAASGPVVEIPPMYTMG